MMRIGGIHRCSLIDYPGKICAILFTQGCNFRCPYCHNPQLVIPDSFEEVLDPEEIFRFLSRRIGKLDAVTISGGEPTLQRGLLEFTRRVRDLGFAVKLDSNGSQPRVLKKLLSENLLDFVAMDVKGPWSKYSRLAGTEVEIEAVKESMEMLKGSSIPYEFRTTWVPDLLGPEDLQEMARSLDGAAQYIIQQFVPKQTLDCSLQQSLPRPASFLEQLQAGFSHWVGTCLVR